jgi:isoleucyl-tRNA synthetase
MLPVDIRELTLKCDKARGALSKVGVKLSDDTVENGDILNRCQSHATTFTHAVQQQEIELKAAKEASRTRQAKALDLKQQISEAREKQRSLQSQVDSMRQAKSVTEREKALVNTRDELRQLLKELDEKIEAATTAAANNGNLALDELTTQVELFSNRLGVRAQKASGGWLRVEFRYINPSDPEQCFSFKITADNDLYEVSEVEPPIQGVDQLVRKLNAEPDATGFSTFCKTMRKRFREPYV